MVWGSWTPSLEADIPPVGNFWQGIKPRSILNFDHTQQPRIENRNLVGRGAGGGFEAGGGVSEAQAAWCLWLVMGGEAHGMSTGEQQKSGCLPKWDSCPSFFVGQEYGSTAKFGFPCFPKSMFSLRSNWASKGLGLNTRLDELTACFAERAEARSNN